jgi:hypothetical protein
MQRTERLVVHIEEAVRLGLMPDESHVRLGLMLLDSAAELMMYRECDWLLLHAAMYDGMLQTARAHQQATGERPDWIAELEEKVLTAAQRKKIEWDFNAKVDFLRQRELLPDAQARVLKKLHKYRNEVYHRDTVRPATLASAVKIYIYVVCVMLRDLSPHMIGYGAADPPQGLRKYLAADLRGWELLEAGQTLHSRIATQLLAESGVAEPAQLGAALAQHVGDRLDDLIKAAEDSADYVAQTTGDERWDLEAILGGVQISPDRYPDVTNSDDARALTVPVRGAQLDGWRRAGQALMSRTDDLAAFAAFAEIEDAFEPVEAKVQKLATDIDHEIQRQLDEARGK